MAHFEDCKFFLRDSCHYGPNCFFRHNELACLTVEVCMRWASGYVYDGRCDLRHPSVAELEFMDHLNSTLLDENTAKISHAAVAIGENGPQSSADDLNVPPPGGRQRSATTAEGARPREITASAPVCIFFAKGRCTKGSSCLFSHDSGDQQPQHQLDRTSVEENTSTSVVAVAPLCVCFQQGCCSKGSTCPFSHAAVAIGENGPHSYVDEPKVPPPGGRQRSAAVAEGAQPREATASAPVCRFFAKGRCAKGSSCLFSHETPPPKEQSADVEAKAVKSFERHRRSKSTRIEASMPKSGDAPPKRHRSPQGSVGRDAARVSVDRPRRTKRQRSPEQFVSAACVEGERATKVSRSANGMDGQGDVGTSATTSSPIPSPPSPHTAPPATLST